LTRTVAIAAPSPYILLLSVLDADKDSIVKWGGAMARRSADGGKELTTTSYAILGLLAIGEWTTYELAQQMQRSLRNFWPRAERRIYDEPKLLVAHELARARTEYTGRRPRTVYAITPQGREALRAWLARPGAGPSLEFEGLLKVFLADQGSKEALLANLRAIQTWAADEHRRGIALVRDYLQTGGPFPERLHLIALMVRFLGFEWGAAVHRWATWAEQEVLAWPDVRAVEPNRQALEDYLRLADDQLAEADRTGRAELSDAQSRSSS
jgi:DNA-binding PadR family transcriptional regulator